MKLIETHCHLDYLKSFPLEEILQKSKDSGVEKIITIAVEPENLDSVLELTAKYPQVYGTQGIHPHDAKLASEDVYQKVEANASKNQKILAIGEIGLDYHYDNSPRDKQKEVFIKHLEIAAKLNMPVVIHSRDADQDTMEILEKYAPKLCKKGVIHSFTSGQDLAKKALDLGFYLGFNGIITFNKAENVREIVRLTPLSRILYETDSPFLTPVPHRGKENGPYYLSHVVEKLAELKGVEVNEVAEIGHKNAMDLFFSH